MNVKASDMQTERKTFAGFIRQFRERDEGAMILFSLFMMVLILWFGGMAVDLMRYETTRAKLQGTLDRATLAAADLDQTLPARDVVVDYFTKAGMLSYFEADKFYLSEGLNYRVVGAEAQTDMPLLFPDLMRVLNNLFSDEGQVVYDSWSVSGSSRAEERVSDVEVSLILDVSTSMSGSRITNLRPAARDFVSTVLANNTNAPQGLITVSMIPYSAVVNPGPAIAPYLTGITPTHDYSMCPLFMDDNLFKTTELALDGNYDHVAHFDPDWYSDDPTPIEHPWCYTGADNSIVVHTSEIDRLHTAINNLFAYGNTAIDMGMKWGVGLLDESTQGIVTNLSQIADSGVAPVADGRPYASNTVGVLKVIVLMTDGENTLQYDLKDWAKNDLSYIWYDLDNADDELHEVPYWETSIQTEGVETEDYYWDDRFFLNYYAYEREWPNGYGSQWEYVQARIAGEGAILPTGQGPTYAQTVKRASWQEVYATYTHNRVNNDMLYEAYRNYAIPFRDDREGYPDYRDADYARNDRLVEGARANQRLSDLCAEARAKGIVIYTVAFEAPTNGRTALLDCASSPSHYYDVAGTDISAAFAAIASDIRALKLTQ